MNACTADTLAQLRRRRDASQRLELLDCSHADPWPCRCTPMPLSDHQIDGWADCARYIIETSGCIPTLPTDVLRALWRRGGEDRSLAEKLRREPR